MWQTQKGRTYWSQMQRVRWAQSKHPPSFYFPFHKQESMLYRGTIFLSYLRTCSPLVLSLHPLLSAFISQGKGGPRAVGWCIPKECLALQVLKECAAWHGHRRLPQNDGCGIGVTLNWEGKGRLLVERGPHMGIQTRDFHTLAFESHFGIPWSVSKSKGASIPHRTLPCHWSGDVPRAL